MPGPDRAVAATRLAVRPDLQALPPGSTVVVGCSGGADSLALAGAVGFEAPRLGHRAVGVVVDHGLQPGSADVAATAARQCRALGLDPVHVVRVRVPSTGEGPESSARTARYTALEAHAESVGAAAVLVAHTRDDQAEQVLLGLARGSGARSLSGMPRTRGLVVRPFLDLDRSDTESACAAYGITPWHDPHNLDPSFRRVRARTLLATLEAQLGPGIGTALARSARMLREDADLLDEQALALRRGLPDGPVPVADLAGMPRPLRTRVWRLLLVDAGAPAGSVTNAHVEAADALVTSWHGQGPLALPGPVRVGRGDGVIRIERSPARPTVPCP